MKIPPGKLTGDHVQIVPMEKRHIEGLYDISKHENMWTHLPKTIRTLEEMESFVEEALIEQENGRQCPFVILLRQTGKVIGSTRFLDISDKSRNLEIGWTWLTPSVWGSNINTECKYLLLKYCFEELNVIRVQFKTDEQNLRSQKAIERIGGIREGVLRNHMIRKDGSYRNSVFYSIIKSEWEITKNKLEKMLGGSLK
ncbi:GNAT family N-acetyltransferase [Bacillus atrophaeus]|uniref:GNAT family N-acetyltransferase n=1 Tax=Bacillus atrophaeus TaxID=1452 RepID=UPI0022803D53|nr:GNAT family protein [Bacillus atrophaeus]MCY8517526.1 GNAT family N-acetyltransferase [Bacillus atrophaeus]